MLKHLIRCFLLLFTGITPANVLLNVLMIAWQQPAGANIGLLVKGNTAQVTATVKKYGGQVRQSSGEISPVQFSVAGELGEFFGGSLF
ncbi:MAG: hypothetical protein MUC87_20575 [Bacteroidia bacterium]|nr:hypothetical protein [Bacteroidia bacterium]